MSALCIPAGELTAGDVIHWPTYVARVDEIIGRTAKMIHYRFTYVSTTFDTARVGQQWSKGCRMSTMLHVTR